MAAHDPALDVLLAAAERVDAALERLLPSTDEPCGRLHDAMRYSTLSPGKRLRPALALAACRALGGDESECLAPASALEMVHAYSLIHDDLPAMDDDDLRRGRPTSHVAYGEAMAILAGDALHTLACEVLATHPPGDERAILRSRIQAHVLPAIGWRGMVGGQALDMELTGRGSAASESDLESSHVRKTGALIRASILLGAEVAGASRDAVAAMADFGAVAGHAFQVVDDVLDVTSDAASLGKTGGKDAQAAKVTYPAVLGLTAARAKAKELTARAIGLLDALPVPAGGDPSHLRLLTRFILERSS